MELIDRYLNEIARRLPKAKRSDIRDELRSAVADALEGRGPGEPREEDVVATLRELGSPEMVAASYGSDRYLIGPRLYPQFILTFRIVVTVLAALVTLGFALSTLGAGAGLGTLTARIGGLLTGLLDSLITALGIVVLVFALLERFDVGAAAPRREKAWDPRALPAVRETDLVGRFDSIAGIVFPAVLLILLNQFRDRIGIVVKPGGELLLNDLFLASLPWLNASLLLPMALNVWLLWSGRWHGPSRLLRIGCDLFGLYVLYRICQGVLAARYELLTGGIPEVVVQILGHAAALAPALVAVIVAIGAASHLYRLFKSSS